MKSLVDDQAVTYNEIEDRPQSAGINPSDAINYCLNCCCPNGNHLFTIAGGHYC